MSASGQRRYVTLPDRAAGAPDAALVVDDLVFVGGSAGSVAAAGPGAAGAREQGQAAFEALAELLAMAGGEIGDLVDLVTFHTDSRTIGDVFEVGHERLGGDFPAWTPVAVTAHRAPETRLTMSAIASLAQAPKQCIVPETIKWWRDLPASAGCRKGDLLFVAGQYGSDADGNVNTPGDHAGQARNALNRVAEICELAGSAMSDMIDLCSFHQDPRWISAVAELYETEFGERVGGPALPSWTAAGVPGLLKAGMVGQYRAIAELGDGPRRTGRLISATGIPPLGGDGKVASPGDPEAQARAAFEIVGQVLTQAGASLDDVVQVVSFHLDPTALEAADRVAAELFGGPRPPVFAGVGMTGTREVGQLHAIHALAVC